MRRRRESISHRRIERAIQVLSKHHLWNVQDVTKARYITRFIFTNGSREKSDSLWNIHRTIVQAYGNARWPPPSWIFHKMSLFFLLVSVRGGPTVSVLDCQWEVRGSKPHWQKCGIRGSCSTGVPYSQLSYDEYTNRKLSVGRRWDGN